MVQRFDVGVVGLGYVGLTLATVMAEVGFRVLGVERRPELVEATNQGRPHFTETGLEDALGRVTRSGGLIARDSFFEDVTCDVYIITVGTPLGADGVARLDMIEAATREVAANMSDGALVILRSTVKIGTTREVVVPILEASGKSFEIAMCPERTLEGKALQELRQLPQIVGADHQSAADRASAVFRRLTSTVIQVASPETAEVIKLVDNTFRDVRFAFANEVARLCDAFSVNAFEVISAGKLGYERTNVPLPGLVGGPCLEKDPHILWQSAQGRGVDLEITRAGRLVNERQPAETVQFILDEAQRRGLDPSLPVALLGLAFKGVPATDDLRGSMSVRVLDALLARRGDAHVTLFDPVIEPETLAEQFPDHRVASSVEDAVAGAGIVIIANNHPDLGVLRPAALGELMAPDGFIYDYWNHFSNLAERELDGNYLAVGNAGSPR